MSKGLQFKISQNQTEFLKHINHKQLKKFILVWYGKSNVDCTKLNNLKLAAYSTVDFEFNFFSLSDLSILLLKYFRGFHNCVKDSKL